MFAHDRALTSIFLLMIIGINNTNLRMRDHWPPYNFTESEQWSALKYAG